MLSSHNNYCFTCISLFIHALSYYQDFYRSFAQGFPSNCFCNKLFVSHRPVSNKFIELIDCVGVRMRHKKFIILKRAWEFESKPIVHSSGVLSRHLAFFVRNLLSLSSPTLIVAKDIFVLNHWIYDRQHPIVEQGIRFGKINDWKCVLFVENHPFYRKKEPLVASCRIRIIAHY